MLAMNGKLRLRLYVAGGAPSSLAAERTLRAVLGCNSDTDLEVIDVLKAPARAIEDGVFVTPTLIRVEPGPSARLIGDLARPGSLSKLVLR